MRMRVCLVVLVVLAVALLTGCGSSSKTSSSNTNASAATATTGTTTTSAKAAKGPNAIRVTALRACLLKNGIPLPKRIPGQKGAPGAGGFLGGAALPKGVTRDQYQAALKKCGAGTFASPGRRVSSPAFKAALTKFATCLRQNGVNISAPNTSGTGPIFSTKGINTASAQFRTAERKCSAILRAGLKASAGARSATGGAPGTAGATGSAGQTKASPAPKLKVKVPPKVAHALQQFTACMREHGVTSYPEPEGASFNMSHTHIDTKSAQYKAAEKKCNPILNAAF